MESLRSLTHDSFCPACLGAAIVFRFSCILGAQMVVDRRLDLPCGRPNDNAEKHCVHMLAFPLV